MMKRILWLALMAASPLAMATEGEVPPQSNAAETPFERDFSRTDTDMNGAISRAEAEGAKAQLLTANFDKIDANGDGELDRGELKDFFATIEKTIRAQQAEHLKEFSRRLKATDKNKNGKLTKKELAAAKEEDKLPGLEKNFDAIDANHDKSITMQEITDFSRANPPK